MTTEEMNTEQVGRNAFAAGHALSQNPYRFPRPCERMVRLAAAWERGYKAAQKDDWNYYPMAGRGTRKPSSQRPWARAYGQS